MSIAARFLLLCAVALVLPTTTTAQISPPHLDPGWYKNSGPAVIYEDQDLKIVWENSYVYPYPGSDPLYWYAEVVYTYKGSTTFEINCVGENKLPPVKEHMRNTPNSGTVDAHETLCDRNPNFTVTLRQGEKFYDWVTFHNVPWKGGEVYLQWDPYGSSEVWVDPWSSLFSAPPLVLCPKELVDLGTCMVSRKPQGTASNLVVLVHGCCTTADDVKTVWDEIGRQIGSAITNNQTPRQWDVVVWDWSMYTPLNDPWSADSAAPFEGRSLADMVTYYVYTGAYTHIHLIGHSAGSHLIDTAAKLLAERFTTQTIKPFIHLTFLDAMTWLDAGKDTYGNLGTYPHFAEHYVDYGALYTDACLSNAFNFDITDWQPVTAEEKGGFLPGHQWPRYWYRKSIVHNNNVGVSGWGHGRA